jgi:hypothetical protein
MSKLSDKLKEEGAERLEDFKEGADEFKDDVVSFWKTDKKALAIFGALCFAAGFLLAVIL